SANLLDGVSTTFHTCTERPVIGASSLLVLSRLHLFRLPLGGLSPAVLRFASESAERAAKYCAPRRSLSRPPGNRAYPSADDRTAGAAFHSATRDALLGSL